MRRKVIWIQFYAMNLQTSLNHHQTHLVSSSSPNETMVELMHNLIFTSPIHSLPPFLNTMTAWASSSKFALAAHSSVEMWANATWTQCQTEVWTLSFCEEVMMMELSCIVYIHGKTSENSAKIVSVFSMQQLNDIRRSVLQGDTLSISVVHYWMEGIVTLYGLWTLPSSPHSNLYHVCVAI